MEFASSVFSSARRAGNLRLRTRPIADAMEGVEDFADTAARLAGIDLLISVDTSMVHLAGGLGMPVWMLSRFDGCWRWLERRNDTPGIPPCAFFANRRRATGPAWSPKLPPLYRRCSGQCPAFPARPPRNATRSSHRRTRRRGRSAGFPPSDREAAYYTRSGESSGLSLRSHFHQRLDLRHALVNPFGPLAAEVHHQAVHAQRRRIPASRRSASPWAA